jgi:hypothetical protein
MVAVEQDADAGSNTFTFCPARGFIYDVVLTLAHYYGGQLCRQCAGRTITYSVRHRLTSLRRNALEVKLENRTPHMMNSVGSNLGNNEVLTVIAFDVHTLEGGWLRVDWSVGAGEHQIR